jgi:hypothetical protein
MKTLCMMMVLALAAPALAGDAKAPAQARWTFARVDPDMVGKDAKTHVIRDIGDLIKAAGLAGDGRTRIQLARYLKEAFNVDEMNYEKKMLVVIAAGTQTTGGYKLEASKAVAEGKTLTIHWKLTPPDGAATDALTHPAIILYLDRFDGDVRFVPAVGKK